MGQQYKYDFSVVMSIYNVEEFLREAVECLIQQTIGFSRIQLIMVDDGSPDKSGVICDEYSEKYPENVVVVHKKNGGLSSSRNIGLPLVKGKYVSFLDPDDTLPGDTFQKVFSFMENHPEVDISCIPLFFFGKKVGPHVLNNKFEQGTRVIDLLDDKNADLILLSSASAFYRSTAAVKLCFDTELYTAEDAKENLRLLMDNPRLGVISETKYNYRKHGNSILDKTKITPAWYLTYLQRFSEWALDEAEKKYGYVPKFVQHTVMYDLQWKLQQNHVPEGVLSEKDLIQYRGLLFDLTCRIDEDVILHQDSLGMERKLYLLEKKRRKEQADQGTKKNKSSITRLLEDLSTVISFVYIKENALFIEGFQVCPDIGLPAPKTVFGINKERFIQAESVNYIEYLHIADEQVAVRHYYKAEIPLGSVNKQKKAALSVYTCYGESRIRQRKIITGRYAPVSARFSRSWYFESGYMIRPLKSGLMVCRAGSDNLRNCIFSEIAFLVQIAKEGTVDARKAVICRILYHVLYPFMPKNIWLIADKAERADDNGEAFFKYLVSLGKKAECVPVFAVGKRTPDYRRLKKLGAVVPYLSWRHKLIHLLAAHTISAYSHDEISSPFFNYSDYYGDILSRNRVVFLQHGITKDDISDGVNRYHKNFSLFVTSVKREWESIAYGNYGYRPEQIILTGQPRYDLLYTDTKKIITVMPTWYRKLCGNFIPEESRWELLPGFENSDYYKFYTKLLTDDRLLTAAAQYGYKIRFLIHPVFLWYVDRFKIDRRVEVMRSEVVYRKVFAESALITTDYSSVAFDFAYLKKPVVYTHFEKNHYAEGYFDYERDGFGEVEHTVDDTVDRLIQYMEDGCRLKDKYRERIERFFEFHDKKNCERVYKAIKDMDSENSKKC